MNPMDLLPPFPPNEAPEPAAPPRAPARRSKPAAPDSQAIARHQQRHQHDEFRSAVRALLMTPLMGPTHDAFATVRRHADALRDWFAREAGWVLLIERAGARLFKRPGDLGDASDATRGLPGYDRRRYALLCLACAVLDRADAQITLQVLGERLLELAAEPALAALGFSFTLATQAERRELVSVCRTLLALGMLQRVAGDEEAFVQASGEQADALYDVQRRALAGLLAAVRGPSTWPADAAPMTLDARLRSLVDEHVADSDEGRRTALRHRLARRLLDDPVIYTTSLDLDARNYFMNQRGALAARLCAATGLVAEQRAEGLALVDDSGELTDVSMPAEGTDAHVTLLVAELLATAQRRALAADGTSTESAPATFMRDHDVAAFLRDARDHYGRFWRKSAREAGAEHELAELALARLAQLQLITRSAGIARPLPALARFAMGDGDMAPAAPRPQRSTRKTLASPGASAAGLFATPAAPAAPAAPARPAAPAAPSSPLNGSLF